MNYSKYSILILHTLILCSILVTESVAQDNPPNSLVNSDWQLVEFQSMSDQQGISKPSDPSLYTLRFNEDSTIVMKLNCNRAAGRWIIPPSQSGTSGQIEFGPLAVTRALCPPPSMDEMIAAQFQYIRGYMIRNDSLFLSLMADGGIFVWEQTGTLSNQFEVPKAPENGGPRNFSVLDHEGGVPLYSQRASNSEIQIRYEAGDLLDNFGCETVQNSVWCNVQRLGGGPVGYIKYRYLEPATSTSGFVPSGPDDSALRIGQGDYDASGRMPCKLSEAESRIYCDFTVARAGGGYATVQIERPQASPIVIFFRMGIPIGVNSSEADEAGEFSADKREDLHIIRIGEEIYEFPDAVIFGG